MSAPGGVSPPYQRVPGTGPYDQSKVGIIGSGGDSSVPQQWKEADFHCRITGPYGWINLDDHQNYIVAAESFAASATTWRRTQVTGPYVAGKFTVSAVPDQVTENVTIYVLGESQTEMQINLANLIDAVSQPAFELQWSADNAVYIWQCDCADYTVDFVAANLYARHLAVKLQIPRNPVLGMGGM
jgi:hypothetical protein